MSKFDLTSGSTSTAETPAYVASPVYSDNEEEEDNLPYPTELPRSDFLKPDFDPQEYLSSLRNRHQALEDLRSDLRTRSQTLNQELLDLVNGNYEEFLSLGSDLNGGEDKVEGVRVGLLGFTRDIEALQSVVHSREEQFGKLLEEGKHIRREVVLGRRLLDTEAKVASLEGALGLSSEGVDDDATLDEDLDEEEVDEISAQLKRLSRRVENYLLLLRQIDSIGEHPFLTGLSARIQEIRKTITLDLSSSLRDARASKNADNLLRINSLFIMIDAQKEAVKLLKTK